MKDFTEDVTHLVAGVVGSKKYQVLRPKFKIYLFAVTKQLRFLSPTKHFDVPE